MYFNQDCIEHTTEGTMLSKFRLDQKVVGLFKVLINAISHKMI